MSEGKYIFAMITWRHDAAVHVFEAEQPAHLGDDQNRGSVAICGAIAEEGLCETDREPTCRECRRAYARLTQPHPSTISVGIREVERSMKHKLI